jgi:putative PIN family toxin of toxin-antitoxin system
LNDVLSKKDFSRYITEKERYTFIARLLEAAKYYKLAVHIDACRDPKDNKFLELAVGTNAAAIITGDRDLLVLHPYGGITILAPHAFLKHGWKK